MNSEIIKETVIRYMTVSDIPEVSEIERSSFSVPWSESAFQDSLRLSYATFFVAEAKHQILGYCGLYQLAGEGDITNIAVRQEYRGMGIGGRLLEAVLNYSAKNGITDITLEVRKSNAPAIRLYERYGFENAGIRKNFYEKPVENALIMWKRGIKIRR